MITEVLEPFLSRYVAVHCFILVIIPYFHSAGEWGWNEVKVRGEGEHTQFFSLFRKNNWHITDWLIPYVFV
jgi:hypothetical protein